MRYSKFGGDKPPPITWHHFYWKWTSPKCCVRRVHSAYMGSGVWIFFVHVVFRASICAVGSEHTQFASFCCFPITQIKGLASYGNFSAIFTRETSFMIYFAFLHTEPLPKWGLPKGKDFAPSEDKISEEQILPL